MGRVIFEMANLSLNEVYIGMTEDVDRRVKELQDDPPPSIAHWNFGTQTIEANPVESFEDHEDGVRFFKQFCNSFDRSKGRTIRCEEDCESAPQHDGKDGIVPCSMNCGAARKDR
jgi:hypothetical protein